MVSINTRPCVHADAGCLPPPTSHHAWWPRLLLWATSPQLEVHQGHQNHLPSHHWGQTPAGLIGMMPNLRSSHLSLASWFVFVGHTYRTACAGQGAVGGGTWDTQGVLPFLLSPKSKQTHNQHSQLPITVPVFPKAEENSFWLIPGRTDFCEFPKTAVPKTSLTKGCVGKESGHALEKAPIHPIPPTTASLCNFGVRI